MNMTPGVAIIGCGLIGQKRAKALGSAARLVACCDLTRERAEALAATAAGAAWAVDWRAVIDRPDVHIVIVATTNDALAEISRFAVEAGKHVIVEKPAARSVAELDTVIDAVASTTSGRQPNVERDNRISATMPAVPDDSADDRPCDALRTSGPPDARTHRGLSIDARTPGLPDARTASPRPLVRVGFNHRYHPALLKARELVDAGAIGPLMFVRGRYGHGARVGYDKEWRANPALSGGGELIDQGVHLIDLSRWFLGDFVHVHGFAHTYFWQMPVDDNAFMTLRTASNQAAFLHVSCTEWKNLFSLEIYGRDGKLHIEGLGGSYGVEKLAFHRMLPEMGPPETTIWEFPRGDQSWTLEFAEFLDDIRVGRTPSAGLAEARAALAVVEEIHRQSGYDFAAAASGSLA